MLNLLCTDVSGLHYPTFCDISLRWTVLLGIQLQPQTIWVYAYNNQLHLSLKWRCSTTNLPPTDSRNKHTTSSYLYIILPEQHCPMLLLSSSKSCKLVLLLPFLVRAFVNDFLSIHSETGFLSRPLFPQLLKIWFYSIWSWTCIIRPGAHLMSFLQEIL